MKQFVFKHAFLVALSLCLGAALFMGFSARGKASATALHVTTALSTCSDDVRPLGTIWYPGNSYNWLTCSGRELKLMYQTDNNFVLYCDGNAIWATGTNETNLEADYAQFQYDGNLVIYVISLVGTGEPWWATGTNGKGATKFVLQKDANLVIYNGSNQALWASNTSGRC